MHQKTFSYSLLPKIKFNLSYLFYKLIIFNDTKHGTARIYLAEFIWIFNQFFKLKLNLPNLFKTDFIETKFGKFFITPDLISTITVSPAFEREDINFLLKLINADIKNRKKILFIDIGANFGLYSVIVGNRFKEKIDIISFEPNTTYLTLPTYALLNKNIQLNKIKNIRLYKIGIGSKNTKTVNKEGFTTRTLDSVIEGSYLRNYETVFIKMDVDDFVLDALKGIEVTVKRGKKTILLVEDFVDKKCIGYLNKNFDFIAKLSDYNSFWIKN